MLRMSLGLINHFIIADGSPAPSPVLYVGNYTKPTIIFPTFWHTMRSLFENHSKNFNYFEHT